MQLLYKFHIFYRYFDANISANEIRELLFATKRFADLSSTENDRIYRSIVAVLKYMCNTQGNARLEKFIGTKY